MTTKYQAWLTFNSEKEKLQLPVLPEMIKVSMGSNDQSVDVAGLGEILVAQNRPATEFSFSSFFPAARFPGLNVANLSSPKTYRDKITEWKNSTKPVHFIVTGLGIDVYCRIIKFVPSESGGDVGTINYDITLKEYRTPNVRKVKIESSNTTATVTQDTTRTDNTTTPSTYTVKSGDCLYNISRKLLGDGAKWNTLYTANKSTIGGNPNLIYPGQVLSIPSGISSRNASLRSLY